MVYHIIIHSRGCLQISTFEVPGQPDDSLVNSLVVLSLAVTLPPFTFFDVGATCSGLHTKMMLPVPKSSLDQKDF